MKKEIKDWLITLLGIIVLMFVLWLMSGCSPQKQLAKLMRTHPEMFKDSTHSVIRHDTITTKEIHKDSVIHNITNNTHDTIFIKENHLTIKYLYKGGDSAYIAGVMAPYKIPHTDTTIYKTTTIIKETHKPKDGWDWLQFWVTIGVFLLVFIKYGSPLILKLLRLIPKFPL